MKMIAYVEETKISISLDNGAGPSEDIAVIKADHELRRLLREAGLTPIENSFEFLFFGVALLASMKGMRNTTRKVETDELSAI